MKRTVNVASLAAVLSLGLLVSANAAGKIDPQLQRAARTLGVEKTDALEIDATGAWYQFGQAPAPGLAWPKYTVSSYHAVIDYAAPAARVQLTRLQDIEPNRARPAPQEQKVDAFVAGEVAWSQPATGTPTPQPAALEERRAEIWSTPQGFVRAAIANAAAVKRSGGTSTVEFTAGGKYRYVGELNAAGEVTRVSTWVDNPVLGDTLLETNYSDYQKFGEVRFPRRIARSLGGFPWLELDVSNVRATASGTIAAPTLAAASATEVKATELDSGVYYLTGSTHHSVLVVQEDHLVIIEAPQNEARSLAVIAKAHEIAPGKPIRYVVNTHAHFDHSGGLRTYVDEGAIVVTDAGNRAFYEQAWAAPRSLNPDRLARSGKAPRFETFTGKHVLAGRQPVEIHALAGSGHNDAFALVYLPTGKILIEADAWTPGAPGAPAPQENTNNKPNPFTVNLAQNLERLGLEVWQIAALHGPRVATYEDLRTATGRVRAPAPTTSGVVNLDIPGVVAKGTPIDLVKQGFDGTEGPLPLQDGSLVFTENRVDRIQRIADDGSTSVFLERGGNPNSLARDADGLIYAAQTGRPGIGVVYPTDKARVLVNNFEGKPFNRPNDLIVDRSGGIWFTDPGPGPAQRQPGVAPPAVAPVPAVYHYSAQGNLRRLTTDVARPNGITLSPDEKTLYVANTLGEYVLAYPLGRDGALGKPRDFAKLAGFRQTDNGPSSGADGLAIDSDGRLYVASSAGVEVFDRKGKALGVIAIPNPPQNLAFAGADRQTLYVVGRGAVWKIRTLAQGPEGRAK